MRKWRNLEYNNSSKNENPREKEMFQKSMLEQGGGDGVQDRNVSIS